MNLKTVLKKGRGQALVETALVLPVILLILMGIVDFGILFNNYLVISNASREAARSAAVGSNDQSISAAVGRYTATLDKKRLRTIISPSESLRKKGNEVTVTIEFDNRFLTPVIGAILPNPFCLRSKTVMRIE